MNKVILWVGWGASLGLAFFVGRSVSESSTAPALESPENIAVSIREALGQGSPLKRFGQSSRALEALNAENLPEVLEVYDMMLSGLGDCDIRLLADAWSGFDARGAFDETMAWDYPAKRVIGTDAVIRGWAIRDPIEARAAIPEILKENPRIQGRIIDNFIVGWAHSGQPGLDDYIAGIESRTPEKFFSQVLHAKIRRGGSDEVLSWTGEVLDDPDYSYGIKRAAFRTATRTSARWEPELTAEWAKPYLGEEWADDGPRIIGDQWGKRDGKAALTWIQSLPVEGERREPAVRDAFVSWMDEDPVAAADWIMSENRSAFHDPALSYYARKIAEDDPVAAIELCEQVLDQELQNRCFNKTAKFWYAQDAVQAEIWLQSSPLDEKARTLIRRPNQNVRSKTDSDKSRAKRGRVPPSRRR
ncbi:MAG: hypothetical protein CL917_16280 [Deltaproteobacteria bacterium]|nr:hypothetical protein [Deltaproteobacteria bacterium]